MSTVADVGLILTPIIIGVGFFFAYRQWVASRNARMAAIILSITERWDSPDMIISRARVSKSGNNLRAEMERADADSSQDFQELAKVANFFDTLGLLVMEGFIDCPMGYTLFGRAEEHYYELYRPIIETPHYTESIKYFKQLHEAFKAEAAKRSDARPRRSR